MLTHNAQALTAFGALSPTLGDDRQLQLLAVAGMLRCSIALNKHDDAAQFDAYLRPAASGSSGATPANDAKRKPLPQRTLNVDKRIIGALDAFELAELARTTPKPAADAPAIEKSLVDALDAWAAGRVDAALASALDVVKRDKKWREEAGRSVLVKMCNVLQMQCLDGVS